MSGLREFAAGVCAQRWIVVVFLLAGSMMAAAQATPAKTAATPSGPTDFSIETEMLTYRALESNSDAMACDVAAYLYGTKATFAATADGGSACSLVTPSPKPNLNVVVLPFESGIVADFAIWRSDMNAMEEIERRTVCSPKAAAPATPKDNTSEPVTSRGASALGALASLTPVGAGASAAAGILALLSSEEAVSPVGGTIKDQALMDGVGRGLRSHGVSVLMPSAYVPLTMTSIRRDQSPFLVALEKLLTTRACLIAANRKDDPSVQDIDAFVASLSTAPAAAKPATAGGGSSAASASGSGPAAAPAPATGTGVSHLQAVLAADGLAQRLGASPASGTIPDDESQHLLMVGALESGGTVVRFTNVLGTRLSYSGGAVDTYALFDLKGQLECSGNVYDYAGSIASKGFRKKLRGFQPDPGSQVIFQQGGCR